MIFVWILIVLTFLHYLIFNQNNYKVLRKIHGPKLRFILGNALHVLKPRIKLFYSLRKLANIYDGVYRLLFPYVKIAMIYNPDDLEVLLTSQKQITKDNIYKFLHPWLNTGLLTSTGEKWQNRRKILTPAFHFNILKQFCKVFVEHSDSLVGKLKKMENQEVNILPLITDFTLHSICESAMGTNLDSSQKSAIDYKNAIYTVGECIVYRVLSLWYYPNFTFNLTSTSVKQKRVLKTLHGFTTKVIDDRRKNRTASDDRLKIEDFVEEEWSSQKKRLAMLDLLLSAESEGKIDNDGIREEVDTFMFEGHDTTTVAITFCLMLLANNPDIQQLAYEEVINVLDSSSTLGIEQLNDLRYLERCIKEALRLYPSVPIFGRQLSEDMQFRDYLLPAGTSCLINIFDMHRNHKLYPNPEKFDPDRFLPENCAKRHNFAFLPFSAGPRNCIGQKFAILELKTVISKILKNFKLIAVTKPDDIIFYIDIVLRAKTPIKIKFIPRN